jgi:hypothetical protein
MIPSTTSGDASHGPKTWFCSIHFISRFFTLAGSIWRSVLYR